MDKVQKKLRAGLSVMQELEVLIITCFLILVVLIAVSANYYFSLPDYEVVRLSQQ